VTPDAKDGTSEDLKAALLETVTPDLKARLTDKAISFADLPPSAPPPPRSPTARLCSKASSRWILPMA
jgi:hypothetical protein